MDPDTNDRELLWRALRLDPEACREIGRRYDHERYLEVHRESLRRLFLDPVADPDPEC